MKTVTKLSQKDPNQDKKMAENTSEDGFLGRWSRRKLDNRGTVTLEEPTEDFDDSPAQVPDSAHAGNELTALQHGSGDEDVETTGQLLTDADMPPIDTLDANSDYSPFFSEGVSKQLRNMALKKLFFSGRFAVRDGLDDYDDDFTRFEPLGDTVTSDMKFHERRKEKARLLEEERLEQERQQREQDEHEQLVDGEDDAESGKEDMDEPQAEDVEQDEASEELSEPALEFSALPGTPVLDHEEGITEQQKQTAVRPTPPTPLARVEQMPDSEQIPDSSERLSPEDKRKLT